MADGDEEPSVRERVVDLLNQAVLVQGEKEKIDLLAQVQELVVHRQTDLLDSFIEEIIGATHNTSGNVKKWLVGFIEEACKKDPAHMLPALLPHVSLLLQDGVPAVVKRSVQATAPLCRATLQCFTAGVISQPEMCKVVLDGIKGAVGKLLDHENDGVRTQVIKCVEALVLMQSYTEPGSVIREKEAPFCLDDIPLTQVHYRPRKLEEEAKSFLTKLIAFQGSLHISSVNLMTCMSSLVLIARARPMFLTQVFESLELLHSNLPPTLSESQVNSVRKHLRTQLTSLLKHQSSAPHIDTITAILRDLGMSSSDLNKAVPTLSEMRRAAKKRDRAKRNEDSTGDPARKRPRLQSSTNGSSSSKSSKSSSHDRRKSSGKETSNNQFAETVSSLQRIKVELEERKRDSQMDVNIKQELLEDFSGGSSLMDQTARWVLTRLSVDTVAEIVMESMLNLPEKAPGVFSASYTPVSGAGTDAQKTHLARLLAAQVVAAGCSPLAVKRQPEEPRPDSDDEEGGSSLISFLGSRSTNFAVPPPTLPAPTLAPIRHKIAAVKLSSVTSKLTVPEFHSLGLNVSGRFLKSANKSVPGRSLAASMLALASEDEVRRVEQIIYESNDIGQYSELIQLWLFALHSSSNDFSHLSKVVDKPSLVRGYTSYRDVFNRFITSAIKKLSEVFDSEARRSIISTIHDVLLFTPVLPEEVITSILENVSESSVSAIETTTASNQSSTSPTSQTIMYLAPILRDVVLWRSSGELLTTAVACLCCLATHADEDVRAAVLDQVGKVVARDNEKVNECVAAVARQHLDYLTLETPPEALFQRYLGRRGSTEGQWDDGLVRATLALPFGVMPSLQTLVHHLAKVYVDTVNTAKRLILNLMQAPVEEMGMESPELLRLVSSLPRGTETLVTRTIHILTERSQPTEALVCQVRELYNRRVSDVRFLIPVISGLGYAEVVSVLPKLVRLNALVVKEVFSKLWGASPSPLSREQLLVELHLIPPEAADIKLVMKAQGMCITDKTHYPASVLDAVLTSLLALPALPTLFMRTVIMCLTHHPAMRARVLQVLEELVAREIWQQPKQWEGFIKCCERALPESVQVLLLLPREALPGVLDSAKLRAELTSHVKAVEGYQMQFPSHLLAALGLAPAETALKELSAPIPT